MKWTKSALEGVLDGKWWMIVGEIGRVKEGSSGKWIVREVGCKWVGEGFGLRVLSGTLAVNDKKIGEGLVFL